jgi:glucose-1-phosphate cytidylyltransferase
VTFDFTGGRQDVVIHRNASEPWKVTVVDTGLETLTGGRVKRIGDYVGKETFFLTYGDGVSDVNIKQLLDFHRSHGKMVTITAVNPGQRYGSLELGAVGQVKRFREKAASDGGLINGGFMVCEYGLLDYIEGDHEMLEREPMERIAQCGELMAYRHDGFWQPMDTLREKQLLEKLWADGKAPWAVWEGAGR